MIIIICYNFNYKLITAVLSINAEAQMCNAFGLHLLITSYHLIA